MESQSEGLVGTDLGEGVRRESLDSHLSRGRNERKDGESSENRGASEHTQSSGQECRTSTGGAY